jgi:hypothetical protein
LVVTTNEIKHVLLWCVGLNYVILCVWFGVFVFAHDCQKGIEGKKLESQTNTASKGQVA